jgi:hypothetical protein
MKPTTPSWPMVRYSAEVLTNYHSTTQPRPIILYVCRHRERLLLLRLPANRGVRCSRLPGGAHLHAEPGGHPLLRGDSSSSPRQADSKSFTETEDRIGDYIVGEFLDEGQFATVKTCSLLGSDKKYASKRQHALYLLYIVHCKTLTINTYYLLSLLLHTW